ncbi:MAG: hypothetical protein M0P43_00650 [Arcobacteraceae bacterium]|nr:hypothetical protein [Arcobacteraceae bacterium]
MTTLIEKLERSAIFEIKLDNRIVYMSADCTNYMNDTRYVVIVETNKFLKLWQNEPNPLSKNLNFGNKEIWKMDKKFADAEKGFSFGKSNPVPLANMVCYINKNNKLPYIAINDGITRIIWLLSNGVEYFPIECKNINEAQLLIKSAGYKNSDICSIEELLNCN